MQSMCQNARRPVQQDVTASTQNQPLSALLFLYEKVLGRDLQFINSVRAKASTYRPVVLTKTEITELFKYFPGIYRWMFLLKTTMIYTHVMNGPGLAVTSPSDALGLV